MISGGLIERGSTAESILLARIVQSLIKNRSASGLALLFVFVFYFVFVVICVFGLLLYLILTIFLNF